MSGNRQQSRSKRAVDTEPRPGLESRQDSKTTPGVYSGKLRRRAVPLRRQLGGTECGAACLAMILSYHGRETSVTECREDCDVGRDGLTALTIARAARGYGLRVKAYSLETNDLKDLPVPAILHWNFNHFVVLERWSPKGARIVDPASGRRRLTNDELDSSFTGVALTLEPGANFERGRATGQKAWLTYLKSAARIPGFFGLLGQLFSATLLITIMGLAVPLLTKVLVDEVLPFRLSGTVAILGVGVLVITLAQLVTNYLRATLVVYLRAKFDSRIMLNFFEHVLSLPFRFFQQRASGDLLMRLGSNTTIREILTNQTVSTVLDGGLALVYAAVLLALAPLFGLLALGIGLLQLAILVGTTRKMHFLMQQDLGTQAESEAYLVEALGGIETLKASGVEDRALDHWSNLFFKQLNVSLKRDYLAAVVNALTTTLSTVSPLLLLLVGAIYVLQGSMSLGSMLALNAIAVSFLAPLASLVSVGQQLQQVGAVLERITDVTEAEPEQARARVRPAPALTGTVELVGASFRYDSNAAWALRDVSVSVEPGQRVALVGPTGSGKSTFAKLLLGLYEPTAGEVRYEGIPLQQLDYRTLRSQIGVVLQESTIFSGSIRQNIAFNDPGADHERIVEAAKLAAIHDEILRMPMGYETLVAEGGAALSGGQRQRLSLARALASKPFLLVLDEATSHLDASTERLVHQNISNLESTQLIIAHRLSTVRNADVILVVDEGRIVERGSHEELLALGGRYSALVGHQLENRVPDKAPTAASKEQIPATTNGRTSPHRQAAQAIGEDFTEGKEEAM